MDLDLCYIDLICNPDITFIYIYVPNSKGAQVHMDLFLSLLLLSVDSPPGHRFDYRNFISSTKIYASVHAHET